MSTQPEILIVDDEEQIVRALRPPLESEGYTVLVARSGGEALATLSAKTLSAVVLDLGLPDMDGKEVIRRSRDISTAPVIVLSARHGDEEKIAALDAGAEDYLAKPFSVGELMARLRVLLRSTRLPVGQQTLSVRGIALDATARRIRIGHRELALSRRETEFMRLLAARPSEVITHREIILAVWGDIGRADAQFVRVLAGQVRQKLEEDPSKPRIVLTAPGVGYQLGSAN